MVFCSISKDSPGFVNEVDKVLEKQDNIKYGAVRHSSRVVRDERPADAGKREIVVVGADPSH